MLTGSQYIARFLQKNNCNNIFTYPGGANLDLLDTLNTMPNNKFIFNRHEQFVGHAAEGFSKSSHNFGVAITTSGPGLSNIITPLQDALCDGIPFLCISTQVSSKVLGTRAFQEVDAIGLTKSCTKWNCLVDRTDKLPYALHSALLHLKNGPVHIDITSDVLKSEIEEMDIDLKSKNYDQRKEISSMTQYKIQLIANGLNNAKKPVIIAGKGALGASEMIRQISKKYNIPVATTLHGLGIIDESEELSLKMVGMHGSAYANKAIQMADLIIGIGYRFDDRTIGNPEYYGLNARSEFGIVHVDINLDTINLVKKTVNPNTSLQVSSEIFCKELIKYLENRKRPGWRKTINELKNNYPLITNNNSTTIYPADIITELSHYVNNHLNKSYFITTGVGNHQMITAQYFTWRKPNTMITSGSLGTMGVSLPFAIGTQIANQNSTVIAIDGDGSFMMSLQELATIKKFNDKDGSLPIKIFIINNNALQMVTTWQELYYKDIVGTKLYNPSFKKLGESFGIKSLLCKNRFKLKETIRYMMDYQGPILCEFIVSDSVCKPFVQPGKALDDMLL